MKFLNREWQTRRVQHPPHSTLLETRNTQQTRGLLIGFEPYAKFRIFKQTVPSLAGHGWDCQKPSNFGQWLTGLDAGLSASGGRGGRLRLGVDLMILGPGFWQQEVHSRADDAPGAVEGVFGAAMGAFFGKHGESFGEQNGPDGDVHPDQRPHERGC
jgi:hypothetical protein